MSSMGRSRKCRKTPCFRDSPLDCSQHPSEKRHFMEVGGECRLVVLRSRNRKNLLKTSHSWPHRDPRRTSSHTQRQFAEGPRPLTCMGCHRGNGIHSLNTYAFGHGLAENSARQRLGCAPLAQAIRRHRLGCGAAFRPIEVECIFAHSVGPHRNPPFLLCSTVYSH